MRNKIVNTGNCMLCKIGSGLAFSAYAAFLSGRAYKLWPVFPLKERVFNVCGIGFVMLIALAQFNASYNVQRARSF